MGDTRVEIIPYSPIGQLILLVSVEASEFRKQKGKALSRVRENITSKEGIEQAVHIETQVSLQPDHIHVGPVEDLGGKISKRHMENQAVPGKPYFENSRISKDLVEDLELVAPRLQRVDDPVLFPGADLHQADNASVGPEVVVLQIHGNLVSVL